MMNKKAQGLSINIIIVAALALIILVVLIMVFTGRISIFGQGLDEATAGQACAEYQSASGDAADWYNSCPDETVRVFNKITDANSHPGQVCCVPKQ